jgi:hypothetical protein
MNISRIISLTLRLAQFVTAAVVLGLTSYFLHQYNKYGVGPFNRLVYSAVIAAISVCLSLLWAISPSATLTHIGIDLIFSGAWFAVFGLLQDYSDDGLKCGSTWAWGNIDLTDNYCGQWNAAQAFAFLTAIFWFASFLVGILAWSKAKHAAAATDGAPAR